MPKQESIDTLLSPLLRVSRPVAACSRCRGAKIKCDGRLPACTACERSGKAESCSGANDEFAKGKERSYVAALEAAVERLQRRVGEARTSQTSANQEPFGNTPFLLHPTSPPRSSRGGRQQRKEASDVDDLVGDFGFLFVTSTLSSGFAAEIPLVPSMRLHEIFTALLRPCLSVAFYLLSPPSILCRCTITIRFLPAMQPRLSSSNILIMFSSYTLSFPRPNSWHR